MLRDVNTFFDDFIRPMPLAAATPEPGTGWTIADVSSAGTPTYLSVSSNAGEFVITLVSTSEVQNVCLYFGDVLPFNINRVKWIRFSANVTTVGSGSTIVMGLGSARHDTPDSVATNAWFRMEGSASTSLVVVESDDGTTDLDDKATGLTLSTTYKEFEINFENGLADVRFFMSDANGRLARVAASTTFDMSAASSTAKVQPIFQVQKASGTNVPILAIDFVEICYKRAA